MERVFRDGTLERRSAAAGHCVAAIRGARRHRMRVRGVNETPGLLVTLINRPRSTPGTVTARPPSGLPMVWSPSRAPVVRTREGRVLVAFVLSSYVCRCRVQSTTKHSVMPAGGGVGRTCTCRQIRRRAVPISPSVLMLPSFKR